MVKRLMDLGQCHRDTPFPIFMVDRFNRYELSYELDSLLAQQQEVTCISTRNWRPKLVNMIVNELASFGQVNPTQNRRLHRVWL
jgi:hypothetical protein